MIRECLPSVASSPDGKAAAFLCLFAAALAVAIAAPAG